MRKKGETITSTALAVTVTTEPKKYGGYDLPEMIKTEQEKLPVTLLARVYIKPGLSEVDRYHAKFGDIGIKYLKRCIPSLKVPTQYRCEVCLDGKMHRFNHKACAEGVRTVYEPGTCIHSDHSGPYVHALC
jgi:hypothetical protein